MENKVKHICQYNEKCKIAERCTVAVEITNIDDASNNIRRYIQGRGECEVENESNS